MKKLQLLCFLILLIMCSALWAKGEDSLFLSLKQKAEINLKNMPSYAKRDYAKLLKKHPDRVMAFLLAYEENGRLAVTDPHIVEEHYRSVIEMMKEQGIKEADEFFLSYVAKITVSDESITDYRRQFESDGIYDKNALFDGLGLKNIRQQTKDELELYRIVCLKTTELLMYKPTSGRDLSPMDVAAKSLVGRCEESQIIFVALCRTLGLPARSASTPWWAHQDDNHAWAEVFINGKWHYSGDADGGYWPNQTWFTSLANKMVIVAADGSLPAPNDEVLAQDQYGAVINSIKYYAGENTRTLKLKVLDKDGKSVPKVNLGIDVYNFFSLRPQTFIQTDDNGEKTITVGQGAFFVMAFKDSLAALQFVPSNHEKELSYTISLVSSELAPIDAIMVYPANKTDFVDAPQSWKDAVKTAQNSRQAKLDAYEQMCKPEFFSKIAKMSNPELVAYMDTISGGKPNSQTREIIGIYAYNKALKDIPLPDSLFFEVLKKTRLNMHYWLGFDMNRMALTDKTKNKVQPISPQWLEILLMNDEKDLWQANGWLFYRMYKWFEYVYPKVSYLPENEMLNLFEPTVFYENLPWQSHYLGFVYATEGVYPKQMILKKPLKPSVQQVVKHFQKKHRINADKAIIGLIPLETAFYQKNLTAYQYKILACYYLRANQIPANYSRIPYVISVYTDGAWKYYDVVKNRYYEMAADKDITTNKIQFNFSDKLGQPIALKPEQVHICFLKDGQFFPTNEQPDYLGNGVFETKVSQGEKLYAQIGYRNSDSLTVYYLRPLAQNGKILAKLDMQLEHYYRKWLPAEEFLKPIIKEMEDRQLNYAVLGNYSQENSIRMANKLKSLQKGFILLGYQEASVVDYDYAVLTLYLDLVKEVPSLQTRTITLAKDVKSGSWNMYEGLWDDLP